MLCPQQNVKYENAYVIMHYAACECSIVFFLFVDCHYSCINLLVAFYHEFVSGGANFKEIICNLII